jgi:hypothetical protein
VRKRYLYRSLKNNEDQIRDSHDSDCKDYCLFGCDVMYSGSSAEVSEEPAVTTTRFEEINSHTLTMVGAHPSMTSVHYYQTTWYHISENC